MKKKPPPLLFQKDEANGSCYHLMFPHNSHYTAYEVSLQDSGPFNVIPPSQPTERTAALLPDMLRDSRQAFAVRCEAPRCIHGSDPARLSPSGSSLCGSCAPVTGSLHC